MSIIWLFGTPRGMPALKCTKVARSQKNFERFPLYCCKPDVCVMKDFEIVPPPPYFEYIFWDKWMCEIWSQAGPG